MGILDIPQEVESIGENAFSNCKMLEASSFQNLWRLFAKAHSMNAMV